MRLVEENDEVRLRVEFAWHISTYQRGSRSRLSLEGAKNSPGRCRPVPYTSLAAIQPMSSFKAVRIQSKTKGRASIHCSGRGYDFMAAFSYRCKRSTSPFDIGW